MQAKKILGIIVKPENRARIEAALEAVQGKAHTRTVTYEDIADRLQSVGRVYCIPETALKGTKVSLDLHAESLPRAYKRRPKSTQVEAIYTGAAWEITDIRRGYTRWVGQKVLFI